MNNAALLYEFLKLYDYFELSDQIYDAGGLDPFLIELDGIIKDDPAFVIAATLEAMEDNHDFPELIELGKKVIDSIRAAMV